MSEKTEEEVWMDVSINGIVTEVLIDSGLVNNLIGEEDFQKLRGRLNIVQRNCLLMEGRGLI